MHNKLGLALALVAGLFGGMLTRFIAPPAVSAQAQPVQEIRSRSFVLVDSANATVGAFTTEPVGGQRVIIRPNERPQVAPRASRIVLRDATGRVIWSAGPGANVLPLEASR